MDTPPLLFTSPLENKSTETSPKKKFNPTGQLANTVLFFLRKIDLADKSCRVIHEIIKNILIENIQYYRDYYSDVLSLSLKQLQLSLLNDHTILITLILTSLMTMPFLLEAAKNIFIQWYTILICIVAISGVHQFFSEKNHTKQTVEEINVLPDIDTEEPHTPIADPTDSTTPSINPASDENSSSNFLFEIIKSIINKIKNINQ